MLASVCQQSPQELQHRFPSWYKRIFHQISIAKQLNIRHRWGFAASDFHLLDYLDEFVPATETEMPLVAIYLPEKDGISGVQRTFDELWEAAILPDGYVKSRADYISSNPSCLSLVEGIIHKPGIEIVGFDPNTTYLDISYFKNDESKWLASSEILSANIMFENWVRQCDGMKKFFPEFGGYRFAGKHGNFDETLRLHHFSNENSRKELCLYSIPRDLIECWATPTVRRLDPRRLAA